MAKKTKKAGKAGKIPKEIGGVKLSKPLRKSAEALLAEVNRPATRNMLATGATMLVGAVMAARAKGASPSPPPKPGATTPPPKPGATTPPPSETDQIVDALSSAARQAMERMFAPKR